ncbi:restriction endonuclease subunit S [Pseudoalteromonas prydzensis]|uniref:restriction endonuclease subunit S n=1 Tax=Pseudoalteromonas prydzensis TaxID=182141 RepID=UPI0037041370
MSNLKKITVDGSFKHDLQIPNSWAFDELQEVIEVVGGSQPPKSDFYSESSEDRIRLIQIRDYKSDKNIVYIPREKAKRFVFKDEIMIGRYGPPIFQILRGLEGAYNVALMKAKPRDNIFSNEYLFYYLKNQNIYRYVESASDRTAGQSGVNKRHLEKYPVGVPPLNEQKRIVEKLDSVLAQVDTIQQRLNNLPDIIKRFRQSVLAAAVSGKLTEQWRELSNVKVNIDELKLKIVNERKELGFKTPRNVGNIDLESVPFEIPTSWSWEMMGNLSVKITDGAHNTPKVFDEGHPYLMAKDLTKGKLDFSENRFISEKDHRELYNKCRPEVGDLLIVNIGAGTGNNVSVNVSFEFSFKNIAIIKKSSFIESKYLKWYFDSQKQRIFNEQTRGGAQPFLSLTVLNNLEFALPPIEEQTEIVRLVEQYFALADTLEKNLANAKQRVDNLTQSILAKAFRGELVPQDPNDEPADKLLARIKAARLEAEKLEKAAKKAAKASKK